MAEEGLVGGYICAPHGKQSSSLVEDWKKSTNIVSMYFATATFSDESALYFRNKANNYILASFIDMESIVNKIGNGPDDQISFVFRLSSSLFERVSEKLNYISLYFTKYSSGDEALTDLANVIARRGKVTKASLAEMQLFSFEQPRFVFPYSKNLVILEVEGSATHQMDQKYCERTRRDVARKGILLNNLVSFSILEKLK